ncbi:hypothetical protein AMAG_10626 [Allomyces macrogynus ATCC 38327]|uniref:Uncharacterized protein n=1 Tax=Allomyces macrogynus (strain ATCC 38327) TaxID=578462 RepID=A0A0L0SR32_ALLM3|nr:hypothetical protein AMAG_10626 [Allomyces macrogynus ATCC 38327]|eukprot:KNE64962.1 hypothetical protein AMAG_10626 [Allomyces macrogynus ATCC 38327]
MGKPKPSAPGPRKGNKAGAAARKPAPSKKLTASKPTAARSSTNAEANEKDDATEQDQDDAPATDAPVPAHLQPRKPRTVSHKKGGKMIASTVHMNCPAVVRDTLESVC